MKRSVIAGRLYLTAEYRGSEYTLMRNGDGWGVGTRRIGLGSRHVGGFKHFRTLEDVAAGCKAFGSVDALMGAVYGLEPA